MDLYKVTFFLGAFTCSVRGTDIEGYVKIEERRRLPLQHRQYSVNSLAECAAKCDRETAFTCRAFSYTENGQTCWISANIESVATGCRTGEALYKKIEECIHCNGDDYRGKISITESGLTCQRWESQTPHKHDYNSCKYQDKNVVENYCRNLDGEARPWCYTTSETKRWEYCSIPRCTSEPPTIEPEMTCITGKGEAYRGTVAVTWSGKTCQSWSAQRPHEHTRTPENYSCKGLERNYCRNPDNVHMPWCYTTDPNTRWEYCDVPSCNDQCISCNGEDYKGKISITESGLACQRWDSQTPHNHDFNPIMHPEKNLEENYCRNPDGGARPWCYTTNESTRWEFCSIPRCTSEPPTIKPEMTCITGKGVAYRGTVAVTRSGRTCQSWSAQRPHQHDRTPENYSCKGLERNYCRNPDNVDKPWCYTTDPNTRWEYCNVPSCSEQCINCNGEDYNGETSETESGLTCQRWDSQTPHNHNYNPITHPEKNLEENYCRNPDGEARPWCYTTNETKRWEYCSIPRCTSEPPTIEPEMTCITGKGEAYRGTVAVTRSGKTCQSWSAQRPHEHNRTPENYSCKGLESNYCRNPDNVEQPWCYTTDPNTRWEYCNVPNCTEECIKGDGEDYRGEISVTESGLTCQRWDSQKPHHHDYNSCKYQGRNLVENYCRNPDGEAQPWCYTTSESKRWEYCSIPLCTSEPSSITPKMMCITGKGEAYRGRIAVTESGKTCQRWSVQRPHEHTRTPENYSFKGLERNYCRNPDNEERPWCYTTDPNTRWEYCNVPSCPV